MYDNSIRETQVKRAAETITSSSDLYKKKFCHMETCTENYTSGIQGRILFNTGRQVTVEKLSWNFGSIMSTTYPDADIHIEEMYVQWSTPKGIGWTTASFTSTVAYNNLPSVLELFLPSEEDGSWRGGCFTNLAHRDLLSPVCFPRVASTVVMASHYDVKKCINSTDFDVMMS